MKSKKILVLALTFVLLICGVFSVSVSAKSYVANGGSLASSSWISAPSSSLQKCTGDTCNHENCYSYSFAVVGDTQSLNYKDAEKYKEAKASNSALTYENYDAAYMRTLYNWILANKAEKNIQYVMGLGDITQSFNSSQTYYNDEWALAKEAVSLLDGEIDYSLVRGNHDISSGLNSTFGVGSAYYNSFNDDDNATDGFRVEGKIEDSYRKITIGEGENAHKYIIFTLEHYPTDDTVTWLNEMLTENADYDAIITLHAFLGRDGTFLDPYETTTPEEDLSNENWKETATGGNVTPRELWENSLSLHNNVKLVLSGHVDVEDIVVNQLRGNTGNTVTCMLIDGQTIDSAVEPAGLVAMLYFKEDGSVINVEYISTIRDAKKDSVNYPSYLKEKNQFAINLDYGNEWTETSYGCVPTELYNKYEFSLFLDDESDTDGYEFYYGGYDNWDELLTAINSWNGIGGAGVSAKKTYSIVLNGKDDGKYNYELGTPSKQTGRGYGKIIVDLNEKEFMITSGAMFYYYNRFGDRTRELTIKNGNIVMAGNGNIAIFNNETNDAQYNGSELTLNLDSLNVKYSNSSASVVKCYTGNAYDSTMNLTVSNTDFDLTGASGAVTLFALDGDNNNNDVDLKLVGGSVIGTTLENITLYSLKSGRDTATFEKGASGNYTSITLNENAAPSADFRNEEGKLLSYTTESTTAPFVFTADIAPIEETPYGKINTNDYPVDTSPFVVFNSEKTVVFATDSWTTLISTMDSTYMNNSTDKYFVVMRKSMTANYNYSNWALFQGECVIDLCGNTLTVQGDNLFKPNKKRGNDTHIEMKNGCISMAGSAKLIYYASQTGGSGKFDISFTNINISYASGATKTPLIQGMGGNENVTTTAKYTFTNCTIDLATNAPSENMVFANLTAGKTDSATGKTNHVAEIVVDGGNIIANNSSFVFANYNSGEDSVTFTKEDGVLTTTVTVPNGTSVPSSMLKVNGDDLVSVMLTDGSAQDVYQLCEQVMIDGYAKIPTIFDDIEKYPFIIFKNGKFKKACEDWYTTAQAGAIKDAIGVASASGDVVTIVMRRDYYHNNASSHCGDFYKIKDNATVNIDLGGYNLYSVRELMKFNLKTYASTINVNVSNGSIIVTSRALMGISTQDTTNKQTLNLKFTGVNIIYRSVNGTVQYGKVMETDNADYQGGLCTANIEFEKCTFDFSEMKLSKGTTYTMFICDTDSKLNNSVNITFDGGMIIGSQNYKLNLATLNTETAPDTLKFSKDSGNYTVFKLASIDGVPTNVYNSTELAFVKISEDSGWTMYSLDLKPAVTIDFIPKTSITLSSELIYNVYVPVNSALKSFVLDEVVYDNLASLENIVTLSDGKQYYHFEIDLPASEAARNIILMAVVTIDGKDYNGTWTMSIPKYAEKVIADANEVEVQLVKDVLAYIRAAYAHFDKTDAEAMAKIGSLLGENYDSNNSPIFNGSADVPTNGLNGVALILDAMPTIRFYIADTSANYEFYVNGIKLKTKDIGYDKDGKAYIEMDVYAYAMCETITYKINGTDSGSYHINSYYKFVTTAEEYKNNAELINLVERFAKYCESASAYRNYVLSQNSEN